MRQFLRALIPFLFNAGIFLLVVSGVLVFCLFYLVPGMSPTDTMVPVTAVITAHEEAPPKVMYGYTFGADNFYVDYTFNGEKYEHILLNDHSSDQVVGSAVKIYCEQNAPTVITKDFTGFLIKLGVMAAVSFAVGLTVVIIFGKAAISTLRAFFARHAKPDGGN